MDKFADTVKPVTIQPDQVSSPTREQPQVGTADTLTKLAREYEFFTPALICLLGRFDRDPVVEFNHHMPDPDAALQPFELDLDKPLFDLPPGLLAGRAVQWSRRLYGIHRERWPDCRDFISGITMMAADRSFWARPCFYELALPDHSAIADTPLLTKIPTVTVTVFGLSTNAAFFWLAPAAHALGLVTLKQEAPRLDLQPFRASSFGLPTTGGNTQENQRAF